MNDLERLLDLQANDTAADQLRHRRKVLPERATLVELDRKEKALRAEVAEPQAERDGLARDQKRLEDEIATVEGKAAHVEKQLYDGSMTSPKEAQGLQADLESLKASLASSENAVDNELEETSAARQALVDAVPATLITEYERIRGGEGGIGVARLQGATCMGCHISMAAAEVDVMKRMPADELAYCPDCGRLLVR